MKVTCPIHVAVIGRRCVVLEKEDDGDNDDDDDDDDDDVVLMLLVVVVVVVIVLLGGRSAILLTRPQCTARTGNENVSTLSHSGRAFVKKSVSPWSS